MRDESAVDTQLTPGVGGRPSLTGVLSPPNSPSRSFTSVCTTSHNRRGREIYRQHPSPPSPLRSHTPSCCIVSSSGALGQYISCHLLLFLLDFSPFHLLTPSKGPISIHAVATQIQTLLPPIPPPISQQPLFTRAVDISPKMGQKDVAPSPYTGRKYMGLSGERLSKMIGIAAGAGFLLFGAYPWFLSFAFAAVSHMILCCFFAMQVMTRVSWARCSLCHRSRDSSQRLTRPRAPRVTRMSRHCKVS